MSEEKNTKSAVNAFDNIKEIKNLTGDGKLNGALKVGLDAIKNAKSLISAKEKAFSEIRKAEEAAALEAQKEAEATSVVVEEPIVEAEPIVEEVKPKKTTRKKSEPKKEAQETPKTVETEKTEKEAKEESKTVEAEIKEEVKVEVKPEENIEEKVDNTPIKTGNPNIVIINGKRVYVPTPTKPKEYVNKESDRRGQRGERGERRPYDGAQRREYSQGSQTGRTYNATGSQTGRTYNANGSQTGRTYNAPGSQDRNGGRKSFGGGASMDTMAYVPKDNTKANGKKKSVEKNYEDKKAVNKKSLIKSQISVEDFDEDKTGYRKVRKAKDKKQEEISRVKVEKAVINKEIIPIKELSDKLGIQAVEITKKLFKEGIMKTINDSVDYDTAGYIAADLGIELELKLDKTAEDELLSGFTEDEGVEEKLVKRPPVVTVMGHVDHGKTSVLDRIRNTNVTAGEAGGITQHIGAYTVTVNGQAITFLDTPGHAAFTAMRARGAQITDIAVIVVAADDSVMPQTIEAINHAKAAGVSIIVAANKIDKPTANLEKVKKDLADQEVLIEEWGGDVAFVPVSAKTGEGMDSLLETILLTAEMKELKANPDRMAKGAIVEAKLDKGKGPIATVLVQNGTLKVGDYLVAGSISGKVRAMMDDKGRNVKSAGPSMPVSILGLEEVPNAGDILYAVDQAKLSTLVANERKKKEREDMIKEQGKVSLDDLFSKIKTGDLKNLNIIVKADVQGSVEAVKQSLVKLSNEEVSVNVLHAAVGAITETDVDLADSTNSIIIGFNVRPDAKAKTVAEQAKVDIKLYRIIYEAIEDVQKAMKGMLEPKFEDVYYGKAEVRETFKITGVGTVAGCYVTDGKIVRNGKLRIYREDVMICEGNVLQLKRFKDDVKEVTQGFECGMSIENFNDIKIGDFIECYVSEESK